MRFSMHLAGIVCKYATMKSFALGGIRGCPLAYGWSRAWSQPLQGAMSTTVGISATGSMNINTE